METNDSEQIQVGRRVGDNYIIHQSWRNKLGVVLIALVVFGATTYFTILFPDWTTVSIELVGMPLELPILNFIPLIILLRAAFSIYNERFVLTPEYLIHVIGRLAWRGRSSRMEYSRIQEIEIEETLLQRALGVGDIKIIPLAGNEAHTVRLNGVASPRKIKDLIRIFTHRQRSKE